MAPFAAMVPAIKFIVKAAAIAHAVFYKGKPVRSMTMTMAQHGLHHCRGHIYNDQKRENKQPEFSPPGATTESRKLHIWLCQQMKN